MADRVREARVQPAQLGVGRVLAVLEGWSFVLSNYTFEFESDKKAFFCLSVVRWLLRKASKHVCVRKAR